MKPEAFLEKLAKDLIEKEIIEREEFEKIIGSANQKTKIVS